MSESKAKLFEPSVKKLKYTITIDVYENCSALSVEKSKDNNEDITYHEVLGVLDSRKFDLMLQQRGYNLSKNLEVKNPNKRKNERK